MLRTLLFSAATLLEVALAIDDVVQQDGLIRFPVVATTGNSVIGQHSKRQTNVDSFGARTGTLYIINLNLGTPGQSVPVQFDTGSSELWVNPVCSKSTTPAYCNAQPRFTQSTSLVDYAVTGSVTYGTGYADFSYVGDYVGIGSAKITQQIFGVAYDSAHQVVGILGAGPDLAGWDSPYPFVIDSLAEQGITNSRAFSMDLRGYESDRGSVIFGGIDSKKYAGDLTKLPIIPASQSPDGYTRYWVYCRGIKVNQPDGTVVDVYTTPAGGKGQPVLLDSGYTLSSLPTAIFSKLVAAFPSAQYLPSADLYVVDCMDPGQGGSLDFFFGTDTWSIKVPYSDFVWDVPDSDLCVLGAFEDSFPVLGDTFLRSAYVVYDWDNRNIHLGQSADCGTNLVAIGRGTNAVPSLAGCSPSTQTSTATGTTTTNTPTTTDTTAAVITTSTADEDDYCWEDLETTTTTTDTATSTTDTTTSTTDTATTTTTDTTTSTTDSATITATTDTDDYCYEDPETTTDMTTASTTATDVATTTDTTTTDSATTSTDTAASTTDPATTSTTSDDYCYEDPETSTDTSTTPTASDTSTTGPATSTTSTSSTLTYLSSSSWTSTTSASASASITTTWPTSTTHATSTGTGQATISSWTGTYTNTIPRSTLTQTYIQTHTITSCAPSVKNCHVGAVTTQIATAVVTVCPQSTAVYTLHQTYVCRDGSAGCTHGQTLTRDVVMSVTPVGPKLVLVPTSPPEGGATWGHGDWAGGGNNGDGHVGSGNGGSGSGSGSGGKKHGGVEDGVGLATGVPKPAGGNPGWDVPGATGTAKAGWETVPPVIPGGLTTLTAPAGSTGHRNATVSGVKPTEMVTAGAARMTFMPLAAAVVVGMLGWIAI